MSKQQGKKEQNKQQNKTAMRESRSWKKGKVTVPSIWTFESWVENIFVQFMLSQSICYRKDILIPSLYPELGEKYFEWGHGNCIPYVAKFTEELNKHLESIWKIHDIESIYNYEYGCKCLYGKFAYRGTSENDSWNSDYHAAVLVNIKRTLKKEAEKDELDHDSYWILDVGKYLEFGRVVHPIKATKNILAYNPLLVDLSESELSWIVPIWHNEGDGLHTYKVVKPEFLKKQWKKFLEKEKECNINIPLKPKNLLIFTMTNR